MTLPRRIFPSHGQRNVNNLLGLDFYIHWQTRGCDPSLDAKKTLVSSGLVIGMPTCVLLGQTTQLSYATILLNYLFKSHFFLHLRR